MDEREEDAGKTDATDTSTRQRDDGRESGTTVADVEDVDDDLLATLAEVER